MRPLLLAILAALVVGGCGSEEPTKTDAQSPPAAPSSPAPEVTSAPAPEKTEPKQDAPDPDAKATRALKKAVKSYYSTYPWYDSIKKISVSDGNAEIETAIYPDGDADGPGNALCLLIAGPGSDPPPGVDSGRVLASDGSTIKRCE